MSTLRVIGILVVLAVALATGAASAPARGATCADYRTQAAAQRAADTRDADGDGVYCESLPCPCAKPGAARRGGGGAAPRRARRSCVATSRVQRLSFSAARYPNIRRHYLGAIERGWPRILVLNRPGADARRDRLLSRSRTRRGMDRDEYPPAVGRGRGEGLSRGSAPRGWKADVRYVPSSENRSHGATLGSRLRGFCDGTRFRYGFS